MITLITAVPGSGKTLLSVGLIWKFLEEGRPVYHNINGLQVDQFPNNNLLFDAPDDWTQTPDGSVVFYDECQQPHLYPADGQRGAVKDERLKRMETHRHTGHDLFFITQAPTFVHHHVRKLVGEHIHLYRGGGSKIVGKYTWSHTCDAPNDRREQERADFETFRFNADHYKLYQSSTVHTHKFRIPKKLVLISAFIVALLIGIVSVMANSQFMPWGSPPVDSSVASATAAAAKAPAAAPPTTSSLWDIPDQKPLSGCISSEKKGCQCWDKDMKPLYMSTEQCKVIISRPIPYSLGIQSRS